MSKTNADLDTYTERRDRYEDALRRQESCRWIYSKSILYGVPASKVMRLFKAILLLSLASVVTTILLAYIMSTSVSNGILSTVCILTLVPTLLAVPLLAGAWTLNTRGHLRWLISGIIIMFLAHLISGIIYLKYRIEVRSLLAKFWESSDGSTRETIKRMLACEDCLELMTSIVKSQLDLLIGCIAVDIVVESICLVLAVRLLKFATSSRISLYATMHL